MKKLIAILIWLSLIALIIIKKDDFLRIYERHFTPQNNKVVSIEKNKYYRNYNFDFVQVTNNFSPQNRQDILNIFYTAINSGQENFTFYCPKEYTNCIQEIRSIANNQTLLSHINNFVHPYNGFKHIETKYDSLGKITITVEKSYTEEEIIEIEDYINNIIKKIIRPYDNTENQIKAIHDYIINNSKYDSDRSDHNIIKYKSDIAYGPLLEGYGICGGYTDAMELFLERLNIKSYKISSEDHVWNAVNINNNWHHLDLTWDDPITTNNTDILEHNFFLIGTTELIEKEKEQHIFDQTIYQELKET